MEYEYLVLSEGKYWKCTDMSHVLNTVQSMNMDTVEVLDITGVPVIDKLPRYSVYYNRDRDEMTIHDLEGVQKFSIEAPRRKHMELEYFIDDTRMRIVLEEYYWEELDEYNLLPER